MAYNIPLEVSNSEEYMPFYSNDQSIPGFEELLNFQEKKLITSLDSPARIQAFLDTVQYPSGERNRNMLEVLREREAHCLDGGMFAAYCLRRIGYPPLILDILPEPGTDDDHVLAVFRVNGCWGALAKSNYSGLRFREPVYRSLRELVMSYFEDFFNTAGLKTMRAYTRPISLSRFDKYNWLVEGRGVDIVEKYLKTLKPIPVINQQQAAMLNPLDQRSFEAGRLGLNPQGVYKPK